ncbi:MAG: hypothetical protein E6R03_18060 [Hyphomicrobiaceae bacterium]|nr:MAG: hypothetical protein E6R03_18060 [Hyphomicrobiaceae bacterium]
MITSLTLAVSLSCNISVAEQLKTNPLHVDFSVSGIKQSVCTSEQLETEYLMWLYAQQRKQSVRQSREQKQEAK